MHTKTITTVRETRIIQVVSQDGPLFKLSPSSSESIITLLTSSLVMGLVLAVGGGVVGSVTVVDGEEVVVMLADIVTVAEVEVFVLSSAGGVPSNTVPVVFVIVF